MCEGKVDEKRGVMKTEIESVRGKCEVRLGRRERLEKEDGYRSREGVGVEKRDRRDM